MLSQSIAYLLSISIHPFDGLFLDDMCQRICPVKMENVQIWPYINIKLRYFLFHKHWTVTNCFHCTDNFQCSDKIQNPNDSFSIQLWTFYEHSHLNIHTIFILNYWWIIFECSPKHFWNVPWMLPCPLGISTTCCQIISLSHTCTWCSTNSTVISIISKV